MSTLKAKLEKWTGSGWDEIKKWLSFPSDKKTLDETLDQGSFTVHSDSPELLKPFTRLRFTVTEDNGDVRMIERLVADSSSDCNALVKGRQFWVHNFSTIEPTKMLERILCSSMTLTKKLPLVYDKTVREAALKIHVSEHLGGQSKEKNDGWLKDNGVWFRYLADSPCEGGKLKMRKEEERIKCEGISLGQYIYLPSGANCKVYRQRRLVLEYNSEGDKISVVTSKYPYADGEVDLSAHPGVYTVKLSFKAKWAVPMWINPNLSYTFSNIDWEQTKLKFDTQEAARKIITVEYQTCVLPQSKQTDYNARKIAEDLLSCGETRRKGIDEVQYPLSAETAAELEKISVPEFAFQYGSLWDALATLGNAIHAIPRLEWSESNNRYETAFTFLGGTTPAPELPDALAETRSYRIDDYCTAIDTQVENKIDTKASGRSSIIEPCAEGYCTMRCADGTLKIEEGTAAIRTTFDVESIESLELGFISDTVKIGDITPFLFESAEYAGLYSDSQNYPYSRRYALKWTRGGNLIEGFAWKVQELVTDIFGSGMTGTVLKNICDYKGIKTALPAYQNISYRLVYKAKTTGRYRAYKPYIESDELQNTLLMNQGGTEVEISSYGRQAVGAVSRMGKLRRTRTWSVEHLSQVPEVGQMIGDEYISELTVQPHAERIKFTATTTPDFNRINEYAGIDSSFRTADVSLTRAQTRMDVYGETIVIGDEVQADTSKAMLTDDAMRAFMKVFKQNESGYRVTHAVLQGEKDALPLTRVSLPCISEAFGLSLAFTTRYPDNFSAGVQSLRESDARGVASPVPYADVYGEFDTLSVDYGHTLKIDKRTAFTYADQVNTEDSVSACNLLPEVDDSTTTTPLVLTTDAHPFVKNKDSRGILGHTTQLHMRANRKSVVLGFALADNNPLVVEGDISKAAKVAWLPYKINTLRSRLDLTSARVSSVQPTVTRVADRTYRIDPITNDGAGCLSWALYDPTTNEIYIGENIDLAQGGTTRPIFFTAKSNKV